jgi:hypothetical protein
MWTFDQLPVHCRHINTLLRFVRFELSVSVITRSFIIWSNLSGIRLIRSLPVHNDYFLVNGHIVVTNIVHQLDVRISN